MKERLQEELRRYLLVATYLYVCFAVVLFYQATIYTDGGTSWLSHGVAATKALVLGKFLLLGEMAGLGTRFGSGVLLWRILRRALLFLLLLALLTVVEELVVGLVHGESLASTLATLGSRPPAQTLAHLLLLFLILLPLVAVIELNRALPRGELWRLLLDRPDSQDAPRR